MKLQYKIGTIAVALLAMTTSCDMHDPFEDIMEVGQALPTVSWELSGTVANAGDSVAFLGKYYTDPDHLVDHSEVWALVSQTESGEATLKLSAVLAYTKTFGSSDTIRANQCIAKYPHSKAEWDGYEYILNAKFPTSQTLKALSWGNTSDWEGDKFNSYFPANFQQEFVETVIGYLTTDAYYTDLRYVYVNYAFSPEQFAGAAAKHSELDAAVLESMVLEESGDKSDAWYTNTEKVVARYYKTLDSEGNTIYNEVGLDYENPDVNLYDVYESSAWVFCRYDDDQGKILTSVRPEYMPYFKDLISLIPFQDWVYNSAEKQYAVSYSREYKMGVTFKVVDTVGNVGYTTDVMEVSLN